MSRCKIEWIISVRAEFASIKRGRRSSWNAVMNFERLRGDEYVGNCIAEKNLYHPASMRSIRSRSEDALIGLLSFDRSTRAFRPAFFRVLARCLLPGFEEIAAGSFFDDEEEPRTILVVLRGCEL